MVLSNPRNPCLILCLVLSAAVLAPGEGAGQGSGARLAAPSANAGVRVGTSLLDGDCSTSGFDHTTLFGSKRPGARSEPKASVVSWGTVTGPSRACAQGVRRSV